MTKTEFKNKGGDWLGAARKWIQGNCINGSTVTWGSKEKLQKEFTVLDIEDLALEVAYAMHKEAEKKKYNMCYAS